MKHPTATPHKREPIRKERTVLFSKFPPGQIPEAAEFLEQQKRQEVAPRAEHRSIAVAYDLHDY